ncbi:MAG: hypothetical protein COV01_03045 [Candidatus Taylorbacteria bacterium CG10_big_fil_rev_8_21_14_0_10_41_48]|uniref:tRNA uridine(34) hydroxylase n=1 Tax=Candidatus Taylorbacteria bacterium CG10_big_fil_rev_8_21_14_0_10_41_48 TaxID=1975024 RepID=A0A2M8LBV2_9BACT|nr:MAG: hypothetical protein COV01_03045 [Candidatus Taylorbacteria bacterium CG10_big_fil_rev_8_21_14_0_10_41_48]
MKYEILLYYKYTNIRNPEKCMFEQRALCEKLGLKGRIIVAHEGINGTLEGTVKSTRAYIRAMKKQRGFSNIHWKKSEGNGDAFPKLSVKVRSEIVSLHLGKKSDIDPKKITGIHLSPQTLRSWYEKGEKFTIIDMRNDYEHKVGAFAGSVCPPMKNFRDLPKVLPELKRFKNKKVLTVCTGGVRCEKASGYLVKKGFKDVYQLDGGIVSYMEKYPGDDFKGSLYVFDGRVTMAFDPKTGKREIIGKCEKCKTFTENYEDCGNSFCHKQMLVCDTCVAKTGGKAFCSKRCMNKAKVNA